MVCENLCVLGEHLCARGVRFVHTLRMCAHPVRNCILCITLGVCALYGELLY